MMNRYYVALALIAEIIPGAYGQESSCPCLNQHPEASTTKFECTKADGTTKGLNYINAGTNAETCLGPDYGLHGCKAWETNGSVPECAAGAPDRGAWCDDWWCYVDPNNCVGGETVLGEKWEVDGGGVNGKAPETLWYKGTGLHYSYNTCDTVSGQNPTTTALAAPPLRIFPSLVLLLF